MKRRINLQEASKAEAFGALAVAANRKHQTDGVDGHPFTPAQAHALADLARSFVQAAKEAGADHRRITIGGVSLELQENEVEEVLSIRMGVNT